MKVRHALTPNIVLLHSYLHSFAPRRWYGTLIEARVRLDPFARGWSGGSIPFFLSLLSYSSIFYPYHMLTLNHNSNIWGVSIYVLYTYASDGGEIVPPSLALCFVVNFFSGSLMSFTSLVSLVYYTTLWMANSNVVIVSCITHTNLQCTILLLKPN